MVEFKTGDVVKLKSGGPDMTVESADIYKDNPILAAKDGARVCCQWFGGRKLESGVFPRESLILADESQVHKS